MTTSEAAEYLGSAKSTLDRWRRIGIGPRYVRIGEQRIYYLVEHLDQYLAGCVVDPRDVAQTA